LILQAVNELKEKYPLHLTIIGERYDQVVLDKVKAYVKENNLENIVEIKENLPYQETLALYRNYDLFVLPSYDEPAAYSPVEAMANKLAVIASDTCGTACYIERGRNGYVFKSRSIEDLVLKMELAIKDREALIKMGAESFKIAKQNHSLEYFKENINLIFKK
jgi:glycosyltransferase involved in cell wall biosynthesis